VHHVYYISFILALLLLTTGKNTDLIICSYDLLRVLVKALRQVTF